jgi:hypothetical protein
MDNEEVTNRIQTMLLASVAAIALAGCGSGDSGEVLVGWQPVISFSGHGNSQSEAFNVDSGQWRIKWETKNEEKPGAGSFKVTVHSSVSGRPLMQAVDFKGVGQNVAVINEDPRLYFLVIESEGVDWTISAEQRVTGEKQR